MIEDKLKQIGLSNKESKVYLALLELGPSLASEISNKSGVVRTYCYDILNKLALMGLVNYISGKGVRRKYVAEHPNRLLTYLENQKKKYERAEDLIKKGFPELLSLYKIENKPAIKFYEGVEGVKKALWETLETKKEILSCMDVDEWNNSDFKGWIKVYLRERRRKKIKERILVSPTEQSISYMPDHPAKFITEYRWLKDNSLPEFGCEVNIYDNKVLMVVLKRPSVGIIIESEPLANVFRAIYEAAWQASK